MMSVCAVTLQKRRFALLFLGLLLCAACSRSGKGAVSLPASNDVSGWVKTDDVRTFGANELWSYIDGDAERYVKAGVQSAATTDYSYHNKVDVVVDVYTMGGADGARTIFDSEPQDQSQDAKVGDSARLYSGSLVFRKGKYIVRIVAYQQSPEVQQAIQALGHGIERRLK